MSDILIKNIRLEKPYTDIRIMPDGTYYHPFKCFGHEDGEYEVLPDNHGRLVSADDFIYNFEEIINESRRQLSEKGEDIKFLNFFHDSIVELVGLMPTVLGEIPDNHGRNDRVEYEMDSFGIAGRRKR